MTNSQIITQLGLIILLIIQWLREIGWLDPTTNPTRTRIWSCIIGSICGFLWWLFSVVPELNWILQIFGLSIIKELWIMMILKGVVAGFGATYTYALVKRILKQ